MMPLSMAKIGEDMCIARCHMGGDVGKHLETLGVMPGHHVMVLAERSGDVIVKVHESRLAINKGMATAILVTPA